MQAFILPLTFLIQAPVSQLCDIAPGQLGCVGIAWVPQQSPSDAELALLCLQNQYSIRSMGQGPCLSFEW